MSLTTENGVSLEAHLYQSLSTTGIVSQSHEEADMNVDGSVTPVRYYIQPPEQQIYVIHRVLIYVYDGGTWQVQKFGSIAALNNGVTINAMRGATEMVNYTNVHPIVANGDWAALCYDVRFDTYGSGDSYLNARWTFSKSGMPLTLSGRRGETFNVYINDDLEDITSMHFQVQGYIMGKL